MNLAQNHRAGLIIESQLSDRPAPNIVQITARFDGAAPDADAMLGA